MNTPLRITSNFMLSDKQEFRYRSETRPYTKWQRITIWFNGVIEAIKSVPDKDYSEFVEVHPGEPGYDDAPWKSVVAPNPLRWRFENGQFIQVDPENESTTVN